MEAAVRKAGREVIRDFGEVEQLQVSRSGPADFVSKAQLKVEKVLRAELSKARTTFGVLMEGSGAIVGTDVEQLWIVDPLAQLLQALGSCLGEDLTRPAVAGRVIKLLPPASWLGSNRWGTL